MAGFSSFLKQKAAAALVPSAAQTSPVASASPTSPAAAGPLAAASSKFGFPSFSLPGITLPSVGLSVIPTSIDSTHNNNPPPAPTLVIYPTVVGSGNPNYAVEHASLLGAMHFPKTWAPSANKTPVILVPGTGAYGGSNFRPNFTKLLTDSGFADPCG